MRRLSRACTLSALILFLPAIVFSQPTIEWALGFGGSLDDEAHDVAIDAQNNVFVAGIFRDTVDFGGGPVTSDGLADIFLLRLDPNGVFVRVDHYGSTGYDDVVGVGVDELGNTYLAGSFTGTIDFGGGPLVSVGATDIFLVSFDSQGNHRWSQRFSGSQYESVADMATAPDGSATMSGAFSGTIDFGGGAFNSPGFCHSAFIVRFDDGGNHVWTRDRSGSCFDHNSQDYRAVEVSVGASNNCVVGYHIDACILDCNSWVRTEGIDLSGNSLWLSGSSEGTINGVDTGPNDDLYFVGSEPIEDVTNNPYISRFTASHSEVWTQLYDRLHTGYFYFNAVSANVDGGVIALGQFNGSLDLGDGTMTSAGDYDMFALYLTPAGDQPKTYRIGGSGRDEPSEIIRAEEDVFVIVGEYSTELEIGDQSLTSSGGSDVLVAKVRVDDEVAVAITDFAARSVEGVVVLESQFRSDLPVSAVNVYRGSEPAAPALRIATITNDFQRPFQFRDRTVVPGNTYRYQIGVVDADGEFWSDIVTVSVAPVSTELQQNRPNPFNPNTTIHFSLAESEQVTISIFDGAGRRVRTLLDGIRSHGPHEITWDGRDDAGQLMSSGVYFYRLTTGRVTESKKMVLLK